MKKHQALQAEIAGHEPRINNVCTHGNKMTDDGHFASEEIQQKIEEIQDRWQQLKVGKNDVGRFFFFKLKPVD